MLGKLDVFHVGVVVDDLDAAMTAMGANLGIRWAPVQERTQTVRRGDGEVRREAIRFTYSVDGPPHLELIDSASDALWATTPPGCLHHVGAFADDVRLPPGAGDDVGVRRRRRARTGRLRLLHGAGRHPGGARRRGAQGGLRALVERR